MRFKPVHENYNVRDLTASIEFYGKCPFFNAMQYAVKRQGKREYRAMRTLLR